MGQALPCCQEALSVDDTFKPVEVEATVMLSNVKGQIDVVQQEALGNESSSLQQEMDNLKALVQSFASMAIKGVPLEVVDPETGQASKAKFYIDRLLQHFILRLELLEGQQGTEDSDRPSSETISAALWDLLGLSLPFRQVIDVYRDGAWPPDAEFPGRSQLHASLAERLAMVYFSLDSTTVLQVPATPVPVVVVLESPESLRTFLSCMKVLRLYNL